MTMIFSCTFLMIIICTCDTQHCTGSKYCLLVDTVIPTPLHFDQSCVLTGRDIGFHLISDKYCTVQCEFLTGSINDCYKLALKISVVRIY